MSDETKELPEWADAPAEAPEQAEPEAPAPEEAPEAEPVDAAEEDKPRPWFVQRIDEEKERRAVAEARAAEIERQFAAAQQRLDDLIKSVAPQQKEPPAPTIPDPDVDPFGHLQARLEQINQQLQPIQQSEEQRRKQSAVMAERAALTNRWHGEVEEFKQNTPDFMDAFIHLAKAREAQYRAGGYSSQDVEALLRADVEAVVRRGHADGVNPATRFYEMAKATGYTGKQPETAAADAITRAAAAQKTVAGLTGGAAAGSGKLTLKDLANMGADEYAEVRKKFATHEKFLQSVSG